MSDERYILEREFTAAIVALSTQLANQQRETLDRIASLQATTRETLNEVRSTDVRVRHLEVQAGATNVRLDTLEREIEGLRGDSGGGEDGGPPAPPVSRDPAGPAPAWYAEPVRVRDLWVFGAALGAIGGLVAWLPVLLRAGGSQ